MTRTGHVHRDDEIYDLFSCKSKNISTVIVFLVFWVLYDCAVRENLTPQCIMGSDKDIFIVY